MRGTAKLSIDFQSMISRTLVNDEYVLLSNLDLSSAFDLVDKNLLIKRLKIIGLPNDLVNLKSFFLLAFADDIFILKWNKYIPSLIDSMEKTIEAITKWLKYSRLVVNEAKTELCVFYKKDTTQLQLKVIIVKSDRDILLMF
jgi:hypothetical protein